MIASLSSLWISSLIFSILFFTTDCTYGMDFGSIGGICVIRGWIIAASTFCARFLTTDFTDGTDLGSSVVSVLSVVGQVLRADPEQDFSPRISRMARIWVHRWYLCYRWLGNCCVRILSKIFHHGFQGWHGFGFIGGICVIRGWAIAACIF